MPADNTRSRDSGASAGETSCVPSASIWRPPRRRVPASHGTLGDTRTTSTPGEGCPCANAGAKPQPPRSSICPGVHEPCAFPISASRQFIAPSATPLSGTNRMNSMPPCNRCNPVPLPNRSVLTLQPVPNIDVYSVAYQPAECQPAILNDTLSDLPPAQPLQGRVRSFCPLQPRSVVGCSRNQPGWPRRSVAPPSLEARLPSVCRSTLRPHR